jgi:hypothetical protein
MKRFTQLAVRFGMRFGILVAILVALTVLWTGCRDHSRDVVVIDKTGSYHTEACPRVKMAYTEIMPIEEAHALHLKPCPKCRPDLAIK